MCFDKLGDELQWEGRWEKVFVLKRSNSNIKKNVFNKGITIEGKICHVLGQGTAGFSLHACGIVHVPARP